MTTSSHTFSSSTFIHTHFRTIDGLSIRFAESEDLRDHALLLIPWPESLLAFEPTWARLAACMHLVAIDLPGFGHSQRRDELLSAAGDGRVRHPRRIPVVIAGVATAHFGLQQTVLAYCVAIAALVALVAAAGRLMLRSRGLFQRPPRAADSATTGHLHCAPADTSVSLAA